MPQKDKFGQKEKSYTSSKESFLPSKVKPYVLIQHIIIHNVGSSDYSIVNLEIIIYMRLIIVLCCLVTHEKPAVLIMWPAGHLSKVFICDSVSPAASADVAAPILKLCVL